MGNSAQAAPCKACNGRGALPNIVTGDPMVCPICVGSGQADPNVDPKPRFYNFAPTNSGATTFSLAGNAANQKTFFTVNVYDFWAIYIVATSNGVSLDNVAAGLFSVTLQDQSTRAWSDLPILSLNIAGSGSRPFPLPAPFKIPGPGGIFNAFFNELSGSTNTIQFGLFGYEMIPVAQTQPVPGS